MMTDKFRVMLGELFSKHGFDDERMADTIDSRFAEHLQKQLPHWTISYVDRGLYGIEDSDGRGWQRDEIKQNFAGLPKPLKCAIGSFFPIFRGMLTWYGRRP